MAPASTLLDPVGSRITETFSPGQSSTRHHHQLMLISIGGRVDAALWCLTQRASPRRSGWGPGVRTYNKVPVPPTVRPWPTLHISVNLDDHRESDMQADSSSCGAGDSTTLVGAVQLVPSCAGLMHSTARLNSSATRLEPAAKG